MQRYIETRTPSIILQDTFNWNDTPFSIEFHWHNDMELFFEAVMKSLSCYQEHMSRCAPAVTEMFELIKSMFIIIVVSYMHVVTTVVTAKFPSILQVLLK